MDIVPEIWRTIPGYEGKYEVSNHGRVKSLDRIVIRKDRWRNDAQFKWTGRVMVGVPHRGYLTVKLGGRKVFGVHQLVAMAWIGERPKDAVVNHINGVKTDNRPENLEWTTNRENVLHAYRTGLLSNRGETNGKAVLTDELVAKIRSYPELPADKVARLLGCKKHSVQQVRGGAWSHVA